MPSCQRLERPDGDCDEGFVCRKQSHCPLFLEKKEHLDFLIRSGGGAEHNTLLSTLKILVCNKEKSGVCCGESFELVTMEEGKTLDWLQMNRALCGESRDFMSKSCEAFWSDYAHSQLADWSKEASSSELVACQGVSPN